MMRLKLALFWFLTILLMAVVSVSPVRAQSPDETTRALNNQTYEQEVIHLANIERQNRGLPPLKLNASLTTAARQHNDDMIANNYFEHIGSDGSAPWDRACRAGFAPYPWGDCYVAENIAAGQGSPSLVMSTWMESGGHRDNILNPKYREIGVGHTTGGSYGNYWTMKLGSQPQVLPVFINLDATETTSRNVTLTLTDEQVSSWGSIDNITTVWLSEDPTFNGAVATTWTQAQPFTLSSGNGTHTVYVKFSDGQTDVTSSDTILLNEPPPILAVQPAQLTFLALAGGSQTIPGSYTLQISNAGAQTLNWTVESDQTWLSVSSTEGSAPGTVQVMVNPAGGLLNTPQNHNAWLTITATTPQTEQSPQTISVVLQVVNNLFHHYLPLIFK